MSNLLLFDTGQGQLFLRFAKWDSVVFPVCGSKQPIIETTISNIIHSIAV